MSFIQNLREKQKELKAAPSSLTSQVRPGDPLSGLAATFKDPVRYNRPINQQFQPVDPTVPRQQIFNVRG